jgi:pimeloyl-ACP methyl ester carboxylesterase
VLVKWAQYLKYPVRGREKITKVGRYGMQMLLVVSVIAVALFLVVLVKSPGTPKPITDSSGNPIADSISSKEMLTIAGKRVGFFIKGVNKDNPVLLYLHGGMPDYFLTEQYPTGLDEIFTVVWLDQPGAGLSFGALDIHEQLGVDGMVGCIREFANYLRDRFQQDKIYIMAHSGGTYLGIKVIEQFPELFEAYIGVAQISYQKLSEKMAYDYIVEHYRTDPKRKTMYEKLIQAPFSLEEPIPSIYTKYRDYAMHDLGIGTMRSMRHVISGIFLPSLLFSEYSIADKIHLWRGKASSGISVLWDDLINHNLMQESTSFEIPVYFFHGMFDYTCSFDLAKEYFDTIDAPKKGFYAFVNSAHSPIFEEPGQCVEIIEANILSRT